MKKLSTLYRVVLLLLIAGFISGIPTAAADSLDVDKIIKDVDEMYRSKSSYSEMEMEIVTPNWSRTLKMDAWSKGMDKTFIRILSPKKEEGVGTLRIDNEMWNYLPKTNKVVKIPPSMMMSSWMGSDFTNDDLVKEFSLFEDYTYEHIYTDSLTDSLIFIESIPREDLPVVWGSIVIVVQVDDYIPIREEYYDEENELMRILYFSDVKDFDGRRIPSVMKMVPLDDEGHETLIRYLDLKFNIDIDKSIFSLRNLRDYK